LRDDVFLRVAPEAAVWRSGASGSATPCAIASTDARTNFVM
jgi:hypothetical protein